MIPAVPVTLTQREIFLEIHKVVGGKIPRAVHGVLQLGRFIEIDVGVINFFGEKQAVGTELA